MCRLAAVVPVLLLLAGLTPSCRFDASTPQGLSFHGSDAVSDIGEQDAAGDLAGEAVGDGSGLETSGETVPDDLGQELGSTEVRAPDTCNCDDGIDCTVDSCLNGTCQHVPDDSLCPEGSECTSWLCDPSKGCTMEAHTGLSCSSTNQCVVNPHCNDVGECIHDGLKPCPDEACRKDGVCEPASGECNWTVLDSGTCDDGNPCTSKDQCVKGECIGTFVSDGCKCDSDGDCAAYEDGNLCNGNLACVAGTCQVDPATVIICPKSPEPCIEIVCQPDTGLCDDTTKPAKSACDDLNPCTADDLCDGAGYCKGTTAADGTSCNTDETLCTVETCKSGKCQLQAPVVCPSLGECVDNVCQPKTGKCQGQAWPDGSSCDDGNDCTNGESCSNGTCQGGFDVCVDCGKLENAGHPCDDGLVETIGDFCFNLKCVGWLDATWSVGAGTQTGLTRVSSTPDLVHFVGLHDKGGSSPAVYFVKSAGDAKLQVTNSAPEQPFADLDGSVSVGLPATLYYFTGGFFQGNSSFKNEVKKVCTGMGVGYRPLSVMQRTYSAVDGVKPAFSEMAVVGFGIDADNAPAGSCILALCGRNEGTLWACSAIGPSDLQLGSGLAHPALSALWLPEEQGPCTAPSIACFPKRPLLAAVSQDKLLGGKSVKVVSFIQDNASDKLIVSALIEKDFSANESAASVRSLRVDPSGNLYAAGSHGFLASRTASTGKVTFFPKFASLGSGTPHYEGIYLNNNGLLLAANVIANKTDADGKQYLEIRSGLLAGPPSLLAEGVGAMPFFNQVFKINTCVDCDSGPLGSLGLTDLAAIKDHLGSPSLPGQMPFILVLSATVPDALTGLLRGHGLFLPL